METLTKICFTSLDFVCRCGLSGNEDDNAGNIELLVDVLYRVTQFKYANYLLTSIKEYLANVSNKLGIFESGGGLLKVLKDPAIQDKSKVPIFLWNVFRRLLNEVDKGMRVFFRFFKIN